LYDDDQHKAILFGFAAGQELSEHTASQTALLYFVQGQAKLTLGEDESKAVAGTWVRMAPRLAHSVLAETQLVMLLILLKQ
jgi:quercetin dioxygenase-like cupin family protein